MSEIVEITEVGDELVEAINRLLPQLSNNAKSLSKEEFKAIISAGNVIVTAVDGGIVGALTLVMYRIPTGLKSRIEDVVVDKSFRGKGIGEGLIRYAIDKARGMGAGSVDLTSNPKREAANRLYQRLGFEERDTNVYRHTL